MTTVIEEFVAKLGWDVDNSQLLKVRRSIHGIDKVTSSMAGKLTAGLKKGFLAATVGAGALAGGVAWVSKEFSKIEDAEAAFNPLLGGLDQARELVGKLNKTAATTPFQFENLAGVAQQLLPIMNRDIDQTIAFTRMLGDTAGGNAQKMESITRGFTKAMLKGKVDMESLNMISEAGVPIFQELGVTVGKSGKQLFKSLSAGRISTDDLIATFKRMTSEGGVYFNGMEIASKTLSGKISTLKDVVGLTAAEVGKVLAPYLKAVTDELIKLAQKGMDWVKANKELIKTKVSEFIKKIPGYMEKIAYWVPKIAVMVGIFYGIAAAVKVATVAMDAFTLAKALAGKTGPLQKLLKYFGALLPTEIGKSTLAAGNLNSLLGKIGLVGGAAVAGWTIGTVIFEEIIDPLMAAQHEAKRLRGELDDLMGKEPEEQTEGELITGIEQNKKLRKIEEKGLKQAQQWAGPAAYGGFVPMPQFGSKALEKLDTERQKMERTLASKKNRRLAGEMAKPKQTAGYWIMPQMMTPAGGMSTMEVGKVENNIYVNRPGATDQEIAAAASRGLEKTLKKTARNFNREK